ncbi:MAG: methylated-DNA--[protein]-cysteine S-methyltransferase [Synechococcales bacterium]|nr:methylated-DNA--[protein]-cysteine S-methyltransferase [Synechococcales bacterium]
MATVYYTDWQTPLSSVRLVSDGVSLLGLYFIGQRYFPTFSIHWEPMPDLAVFRLTQQQLSEYFHHQRQQFDLPLAPQGTAFQQQVWRSLCAIPYGQTISYRTMAHYLGQPNAARAVGAANGRNPISIIIPCHRVIATNGNLTGYAGGVDRKQWLIQHEQALPTHKSQQLIPNPRVVDTDRNSISLHSSGFDNPKSQI